jgi:hypothetical protein
LVLLAGMALKAIMARPVAVLHDEAVVQDETAPAGTEAVPNQPLAEREEAGDLEIDCQPSAPRCERA